MATSLPLDASEITDYLYVSAEVHAEHAADIVARDVRLIICMMGEARPPRVFANSPLQVLWLRAFDTCLTPIGMSKLARGVDAAQKIIEGGGKVLVYCHKGRHRSNVMAAAILIANGYSAKDAIALLRARRKVADPEMWYIRWQIYRFERYWRERRQPAKGGK